MNADGSNVRKLTNTPGCYNGGPFFSPDGKRVIFRSDRKKKDFLQIYIINADGEGERALTDTEGVNWGPYWYKDGRHIIYAAADHSNPTVRPNYDLWWMNVETLAKTWITYAPAAEHQSRLTMPTGALGRLLELGQQLCAIQETLKPRTEPAAVLVMAADHGVAEEGVSAYPSEVTGQMVLNFLHGGAAINVLAKRQGARVLVVDMGV